MRLAPEPATAKEASTGLRIGDSETVSAELRANRDLIARIHFSKFNSHRKPPLDFEEKDT